MVELEVNIKEHQKFIQKLSFPKFQDEVYNFMYKKTILESSRGTLSFYILIHFLLLHDKKSNKNLLFLLLDENLKKVEKLNDKFSSVQGNLDTGDYTKFKKEMGLEDIFKYDIFFLVIKAIFDLEKTYILYNDFFIKNPKIKLDLQVINKTFRTKIDKVYRDFYGYKINDVRVDEDGEEHDLSKSVYHMVNMRMSRKLDLSLAYKTDIKEVRSQSPIDITLIQYIDPSIICDIWDKYHVAEYIKNIWGGLNNSPVISGATGGVLGQLIYRRLEWKNTNGQKDRKEKNRKDKEFKELFEKMEKQGDFIALQSKLIERLESSPELLELEVKRLSEEVESLKKKETKKSKIKEAEKELRNISNIEITVNNITNIGEQNNYEVGGNVGQLQNSTNDSNQTDHD